MKFLSAVLLGAVVPLLYAAPPVIIYRPAPSVTVVSPLTTPVASSNQALLNQVSSTITQRQIQHQILTTNAALRTQSATIRPR